MGRERINNHLTTVECVEDVPYPKHKGIQFTKGEQYIAARKKSGNYDIDNDLGHPVSIAPEQFTKHFKEVK